MVDEWRTVGVRKYNVFYNSFGNSPKIVLNGLTEDNLVYLNRDGLLSDSCGFRCETGYRLKVRVRLNISRWRESWRLVCSRCCVCGYLIFQIWRYVAVHSVPKLPRQVIWMKTSRKKLRSDTVSYGRRIAVLCICLGNWNFRVKQ